MSKANDSMLNNPLSLNINISYITKTANLFVLLHEVFIEPFEGFQSLNQSFLREDQSGNSEVIGIRSLLESTSWNQNDTSLLKS